ncbi:MAG: BMP family ABC transporter substrate-binding protein [Methylobacteriaceae bacterium]|nr:BMP family ABC transporter substrate-binding protein [Methylobacteriaceae bacterium]
MLALALGGAALAAEKLKVGFVYVGPVGDFGYSYQHDQGRQAVEKALGDKVETTFLESVPESDSARAIEQLARAGHKLIFTTSFGFMDATLKVAKNYPDVKFEHATGYKQAPNLATYSIRWYEGRYVMGKIAGKMTKTNTIGYIVSFPIPEVVSGSNAFMLGAQSVNPNVKVKIVWVNTWFDPGKEADAAKALISQGADVLVQHTDSAAAMQEAEKAGKLAFGQASDMIKFGPKAQLTALTDNWGPYYIKRAQAVLDGTWKSGDTWGGFDSDMLVLAPFTNMPDDVKKMAEDTVAAIKAHKVHPFQGPITKQDGTVAAKEGETLPDKDILSMNWYIKGIDDKLPQ